MQNNSEEKYLIFDVETTGLPVNRNAPISDIYNWPRVVQLAFGVYDALGNCIEEHDYIIKPPENFEIPEKSIKLHKITTKYAQEHGTNIKTVLNLFVEKLNSVHCLVAHNLKFDKQVLESELYRNEIPYNFSNLKEICTMESTTNF